jgi:hypothetical protein
VLGVSFDQTVRQPVHVLSMSSTTLKKSSAWPSAVEEERSGSTHLKLGHQSRMPSREMSARGRHGVASQPLLGVHVHVKSGRSKWPRNRSIQMNVWVVSFLLAGRW